MQVIRKNEWIRFCDWLDDYADLEPHVRDQWWFRGHANANWSLETTLDRRFRFANDDDRAECYKGLLSEFRRELMFVGDDASANLQGDALELLARHQGLPSPYLDWTTSPYIAAFFAFENAILCGSKYVAVWAFHRSSLDVPPEIELIDDPNQVQFNRRALHQRAVFMRVATQQSLEEVLDAGLVRLEIRSTEARTALVQLEEMTINSTYLFSDAGSAARTATTRVSFQR